MKLIRTHIAAACLAVLTCPAAVAQHQVNHAAHQHGVVTMSLVIEGSEGMLELNSPADSLLGFEGKAKSDKQKQMLEQTYQWLGDLKQVIRFKNTECTLTDMDANKADFLSEDGHKTEHHQEHDDEHDEEYPDEHKHDDHHEHNEHHSDDHHDKHSEEGSRAEHSGSEHSDVNITYQLKCHGGQTPSGLTLMLLEKASGVEEVKFSWIVSGQAGYKVLTPEAIEADW